MLRYLTYRIVKFRGSWDLWAGLRETSRASETFYAGLREIREQLMRPLHSSAGDFKLGAVFSQQSCLGSHNHKPFRVSYLYLLQSQEDLLTSQYASAKHLQNVFLSLRASGSVWELSDQNPRVVKSQSWLDQCSGLQVRLGTTRSAGDKSART